MDPLLRDIAVLVGLLGPTGLVGYVWRSAVWKTRLEARLNRLEERERELARGLEKIEGSMAEGKRESSALHRELHSAFKEEIRRLEAMLPRRRTQALTEKE